MIRKFIVLLGVLCACGMQPIQANDDIQYWNSVNLNRSVFQRVNIHVNLVQKFIRQMGTFGLWNYKPGITYHFSEHFSLSSDYQYEERIDEPEWVKEHRFDLVPVIRTKLSGFNLRSQTKIEHRNIDSEVNWRIREKIYVTTDIRMPKKNLSAFFTQEFFYSLTSDGYNQSRTQIGSAIPLNSVLRVQVFYILKQSKRPDFWRREHGIGTSFGIVL